MRRAQIEIQFNWIMIVVAGALIFVFFFGIIFAFMNQNEKKIAADITKILDSMFTSSATVKDTVNIIDDIPSDKISFNCEGFFINNMDRVEPTGEKIIFAPDYIKNGKIITWSRSWDAPFRVQNFGFITSPYVRYIFITDNPNNEIYLTLKDAYKIFDDMEQDFKPEFYTSSDVDIEDENNYKVRFIYIDAVPNNANLQNLRNMPAEDVTALKITGSRAATIEFFKKSSPKVIGQEWKSLGAPAKDFAGLSALIGAIYSESPQMYECKIDKASKRLYNIMYIYEMRSKELAKFHEAEGDLLCYDIHMQVASTIDQFRTGKISHSAALDSIEQQNMQAEKKGCVMVY